MGKFRLVCLCLELPSKAKSLLRVDKSWARELCKGSQEIPEG